MSKPKLVTWHDFQCHTGFGIVAEELIKDAHKHFDVEVVAINNINGKKFDKDRYAYVHSTSPTDPYNKELLKKVVGEEKPEVIFLFQDIFNISAIIKDLKEASPDSKILSYFPIDGYPISKLYSDAVEYSDILITYSDWAIENFKEFYPEAGEIHKLYHGVNTETFKPIKPGLIQALRKGTGWENKFVCVNVNRYQPRKQLDLTMRIFSMFSYGYNECQSCGHWQPLNMSRCELCMEKEMMALGSDKPDTRLYLHTNQRARIMGYFPTDHLLSHLENAGVALDSEEQRVSVNGHDLNKNEVPSSVINEIYNCADLNMTTTVGEGCGLSLLESAAVGVETIAPKNSAIPEMLGDTGHIIPNKAVVNMRQDNGYMRPIVDEKAYVMKLDEIYKKWKTGGKKKRFDQKLIDRIHENFLWDDKRDFLMEKLISLVPK